MMTSYELRDCVVVDRVVDGMAYYRVFENGEIIKSGRCGIDAFQLAPDVLCADAHPRTIGAESIPALLSVIREQAQEIEELARRLEIAEGGR